MDDHERSRQLRELLAIAGTHPIGLGSPRSRVHLTEGFNRRVLMIEQCVRLAEERADGAGGAALAPSEAAVLSLHVNAYWMHLCGALDNLAWALNYELALFPAANEETQGDRNKVALFGKSFMKVLTTAAPSLAIALRPNASRYEELRRWRDPGAHRIPLCAPPGVVNDAEAADLTGRYAEADGILRGGDIDGGLELIVAANAAVKYLPVVVVSSAGGLRTWPLLETMSRDQQTFADVARPVLEFLREPRVSESAV